MYLDFISSNDDMEEGKLDSLSFVVALDKVNMSTAQGFVVENSPWYCNENWVPFIANWIMLFLFCVF